MCVIVYNLKMRTIFYFTCILTLTFLENVFASYCYPDYCENRTILEPEPGALCLLTSAQTGQECMKLGFENMGHIPQLGTPPVEVRINVYVADSKDGTGKVTAFNLSVSEVHFNRMVTRYQRLGDKDSSVCRHIQFYGNFTSFPQPHFYVSCPFSHDTFEATFYRLEYIIGTDNFEYSRKFVFEVPRHRLIANDVTNVKMYTPFIYVDVSEEAMLTLYIQPLPERFNVTEYKIWLINNDTHATTEIVVNSPGNQKHIQHNFTVLDGVNYFKVAAMHLDCNSYGCLNSTSPLISIKKVSHRLLIMIISVIWIPPVIIYALYHMYKLIRKQELLKSAERKPKCLLVYSPTHMAHVNVMIELTRYLRSCNIHAMIDTLDIPESTNKDPGLWCNEAFNAADIILIATSPPQNSEVIPVIYRNMDKHALRLMKENYSHRNKRYFSLQFPYCKVDEIPEEALHLKRFSLPGELDKLVRTIHQVEFICSFGVSSKSFIDAVKLAKVDIFEAEEKPQRKITEDSEDFLLPVSSNETLEIEQAKGTELKDTKTQENSTVPKYYRTDIRELNLLGESDDGEGVPMYTPPAGNYKFRIDSLNL